MRLKLRKNICLLLFLFISIAFLFEILFYSSGVQQASYSFFQNYGRTRADASRPWAADNVNELANLSSTFQSQYCDYHIQPVQNKPLICLFRKEDDIYVSAAVMKGSLWDIEGLQ